MFPVKMQDLCVKFSESEGKHIAPVWHLKWIVRDQNNDNDKDEILVSVAADGRVTNWSIRKGFECSGKKMKLPDIIYTTS